MVNKILTMVVSCGLCRCLIFKLETKQRGVGDKWIVGMWMSLMRRDVCLRN